MSDQKMSPEQAAKSLLSMIQVLKDSPEKAMLLPLAQQAVGTRKDQIKAERRLHREIKKEMDAEPTGPVPALKGYAAHELPSVKFEPRTPLLYRNGQTFFSSGQIAEIFATRGEGKTWFLLTIALLIAYAKSAMGFEARTTQRVLYIDGEMSRQDIVDRVVLLAKVLKIDLAPSDLLSANLTIVAADWQADPMPRIDTVEGKLAIEPFLKEADVVIIDNRSCLFDAEGEKDPSAWQPAGDLLLSLRRAGKAVLLAHHANRSGSARGIGKPEDAMDMIIRLKRPEDRPEAGAIFEVSIQPEHGGKARGLWGEAAVPFTVELTPAGWKDVVENDESTSPVIEERIRTYLAQAMSVDELPRSMTAAISHVQGKKEEKLAAFDAMFKRGEIVKAEGQFSLAPSAKPEGGRRDDL